MLKKRENTFIADNEKTAENNTDIGDRKLIKLA